MKNKPTALRLASALVLGILITGLSAGSAIAAGSPQASFVQQSSHQSFAHTVSSLKHAVSGNGLMVLGHINQGKVMSMTGLKLDGESFFVGNPTVGKKIFGMAPAAGVVVPLRIYVWRAGGESHVGYFQPSSLLSSVDPKLTMAGRMLDRKFASILSDTVH